MLVLLRNYYKTLKLVSLISMRIESFDKCNLYLAKHSFGFQEHYSIGNDKLKLP